jgi:hypothetical protein
MAATRPRSRPRRESVIGTVYGGTVRTPYPVPGTRSGEA